MKNKNILLSLALVGTLTSLAHATPVEFVPAVSPDGHVYGNFYNDFYDQGRGIVFTSTADQIIDSIGIYLDVTTTLVNWFIYETTDVTGDLSLGQTLLQSGNSLVSTCTPAPGDPTCNVLQWVDFSIVPLTLENGKNYHIAFSHIGDDESTAQVSNSNYYYSTGAGPWTQGSFTALNDTLGNVTGNGNVPAIRVNLQDAESGDGVPEPASVLLTAGALAAVYGARRRFVRY